MKTGKNSHSGGAKDHQVVIFVVDDEPMLLELAAVILEPLGFKVKTFRDAETAIEAFKKSEPHPDLLITDYSMHSMSGLELIKQCREQRPKQRILLVSGTVDENAYRNAEEKPDFFLPKPYQPKELIEWVKNLVSV
jgi:CheY-like chemotaxis protein